VAGIAVNETPPEEAARLLREEGASGLLTPRHHSIRL
jgi:hypothetical protein